MRLNRRLDGLGTVGAYPGASLLYVEGRAAAQRAADENNHDLASRDVLPAVQAQVLDRLGQLLGRAPSAPSALRRVDLAGELTYDRGEDGRELLGLLDAFHSARHKTAPVRERGGPAIESVYWRTPKRSIPVLRAYDKGVESATASPGERIRLERQLRYGGKRRPRLVQWLEQDLGELYVRPVRTWLRGHVAAGTAAELMRALTDAAVIWPTFWSSGSSERSQTGRDYRRLWSPSKVERLLGTLAVVGSYGASWPAWNDKARQRRLAEIRDLGLLITDHPVTVDVDAAVDQLCDLWRAAA